MANGTQLAADNFTRANENPLSGGGNWTTVTGMGALKLLNNAVEGSTTGANNASLYTGLAWANDQYSEVTIGTHPPSNADVALLVRSDASRANAYMVLFSGTTITLFKVVATSATQIAQATGATISNGDLIRLTAIGASIVVSQNQKIVLSVFDLAVTSGTPGILLFVTTTLTDTTVTNWAGGSPSGNVDGIWTKKGVVIPAVASDITSVTGIAGTSNQTMLYEGNAQLLSGNVFKMWFMGNLNIYYAESTDGLAWTRKSAAVITGKAIPRIFKSGSTYYLYVSHDATYAQIDQYTSSDGVTWSLGSANVLGVGGVGTWDHNQVFYMSVSGIFAGVWTALYGGYNGTTTGTGLATSPDGVTWTKSASNPVITNARWINAFDGLYLKKNIYYGWPTQGILGQTSGTQGVIVRLQSPDFITWTGEVPSIQSDNTFEGLNRAIGQTAVASVLEVSGTTYLFYTATTSDAGNVGDQIYLATAPYKLSQIITGLEYFANYAQTATDTFQRADGALGANWTVVSGQSVINIASHLAEASATSTNCAMVYTATSFANDQYSEHTLAAASNGGSYYLLVRGSTSAQTYYEAALSGGTGNLQAAIAIYKVVAGVTTQIGPSTTGTSQVGDVFRFSAVGNVLSLFQNGNLLLQVTDASNAITSGSPGMLFFSDVVTHAQVSAWAGGNTNAVPHYKGGGMVLSDGAEEEEL